MITYLHICIAFNLQFNTVRVSEKDYWLHIVNKLQEKNHVNSVRSGLLKLENTCNKQSECWNSVVKV